jgi:RNA polymerase sigma-70 factor, ECF subfamily
MRFWRAIENLPAAYRTVLIMRDIDDLSVEDTARSLGLTAGNVRVRHNHARALLRTTLATDMIPRDTNPFPLPMPKCDAITGSALYKIGAAYSHCGP